MNEDLGKFIDDIGTICEMWLVIYQKFKTMSLSDDEALKHTQAFMGATFSSLLKAKGDDNNES